MALSYESSIHSLEEQGRLINNSYKKNTDLIWKWVDKLLGVFWGETVEKIYKDQIINIQQQAKKLLTELHAETLTQEQKVRLERLKDGKLEDIWVMQMIQNTDMKQAIVNTGYAVKWEFIGTLHGLQVMITGVFDLAIFMGKYTESILGIHPEYKEKINEQASQLYDWIKKEWRIWVQDKIFELIDQEMIRISKLPQEDQAEAIGNIAGNIIGMLTGIKVGLSLANKSWEMAKKVAQVTRITEKLAQRATINTTRMTQVENLWKQAWYIRIGSSIAEKTLNGIAESLIWYGFAKWLSVTWELIRNSTVSVSKKLSAIEKTIAEMEWVLKTEIDPAQRQTIQEEIQKLKEEKVKIQRPEQNLDELNANALLLSEERIKKAEIILWWKVLSQDQKEIILHIHNNISKWVYQNWYSEIREMTEILIKTWFLKNEIRKLMENGILWFKIKALSKTDGISDYGIEKWNRIDLPEERIKRAWMYHSNGNSSEYSRYGISDYAIGQMNRIELPEERIKRDWMYGYTGNPPEYSWWWNPTAQDELDRKMKALKDVYRFEVRNWIHQGKKPESKMEMQARLTQERKWWKRDPEYIMENAKQNGAALLREWENIMRANPWISWEKLWQLVRQRANEMWLKITPTQERILDAQMRQYENWMTRYWSKGTRDNINTSSIDEFKRILPEIFPDKDNFIVVSAIYLSNKNWTDPIIQKIAKILTGELEDVSYIKDRNYKKQDIIDLFIPHLSINIDANNYPWTILVTLPPEILNTIWIKDIGKLGISIVEKPHLGTYQHMIPEYLFISSDAGKDTIEHEYQHFLDNVFLNPILLSWTMWNSGKPILQHEKRYGRILMEPVWITERIWKSMQGELCSYIERNNHLPKDIENYMNGTLRSKLKNWEIPKESIQEMEWAIRELEKYFNNSNIPREDLVGIIRTSYSIEDMLNRLRKKYIDLFPNDPYTQRLQGLLQRLLEN